MGGWTPVAESASGWTPVETPNYEAEAAQNAPVAAPSVNPITAGPLVRHGETLGGGGVNPASPEALAGRQAAFKSGMKGYGTVAGSMLAPMVLPESVAGAGLGKYVLKPIVAGAGAGLASLATGSTPTEAAETGAGFAASEGLFGGLLGGAKSLLRSGMLGEGAANYFSEATGGKLIPTDEARDIQRIHEAIGVKPGNMNIGLGASTAQDAWNLPGRAIKEAGFKPQDFEGLNPFEQAEKLKPYWIKAGQAVSDTAAKATKDGVKFDGAKSLTQAIGDMLDPEGSKALKLANDTAEQLGIKDWRKMTPAQAVELKQKLWDRLPPRFRGPVYGALTRDLNKAVPDMIPVNRTYSEFRGAMDAIQDSAEHYMSRASPTKFDQLLELMRKHPAISGPISAATGLGSAYSGFQGAKSLYDLMTKP